MKDNAIVFPIESVTLQLHDFPEEYQRYNFLKMFDLDELRDMIIATMQFRKSVDMRAIFEVDLYGRWLSQVKEFIISKQRTVMFTKGFFNHYVDFIDSVLREYAGEIITIDTFEIIQTETMIVLIPKEVVYDTEESYSGQRKRLSSYNYA